MPPTVQVTVTLTPGLDGWVETERDAPPILAIEAGGTELCLVLASDHVTAHDADAARRLAELIAAFAARVAARVA
ncbi:hypothetical protein SAMN05444365_101357 [Micromonospora pattaloongensis]|uniref:Uncharacterized protein n=1 Tax=Micromonospora pattaloongensis TaxID=405436 RepID=A0A1H3GBW7_9ACTN|nr:hypothetical protein [Micromonospora pattaloongensis]SDY00813.1 hypothetical protein SAMN05444365_101357 [Micromonospora pattaloongensis]